jgi:peroxiredoxin
MREQILKPGTQAPDFNLLRTPDQKLALSELRGQPVVLIFYPADWSPVCGDELALFNELLDEFKEYNAQLIGISVDQSWCQVQYGKDRNLHFPLLSDFEPKGEVSRKYGCYLPEGVSARALFLIDENGKIVWSYVSPLGVNPGADGVVRALASYKGDRAGKREQKFNHEEKRI